MVAAGAGRRMGATRPKQFIELHGEPVLLHALRPWLRHPEISAVVVVLPERETTHPPEWLAALPVRRIAGGEERSESVWAGLQALPRAVERVLIHDGARPLVTRSLVDRVLHAAKGGAVAAAVPVDDTIKRIDDDGWIVETPDRARLRRAQTPQAFPRDALVEAYVRARAQKARATDDAAIFERYAGPVRVIEGDRWNLKVTHPNDVVVAECILRARLTKKTDS